MSVTLTAEQQQAITARGKVLVSASAGSGKTFVMIERLVSLILAGADVRRTLAVTFTNKAAAQMKDRLRSALLKKMGECGAEERARLKEQLNALPQADISTIHAFCARLVRANFFLAETDAAFRIISPEDAEGRLLSARALDETFEEAYAARSAEFEDLLSVYFYKKKDARLRAIVQSLYFSLRADADYREKLQTAGGDAFAQLCAELARDFQSRAEFFAESASREHIFFAGRSQRAQKVCEDVISAANALKDAGGLFEMAKLAPPVIATMPRSAKSSGEELKRLKFLGGLSAGVKELYKELKKFSSREEEAARYLDGQRLARGLAALVLRYDEIYARLKKEAGVLDYDDLEHCALKVLEDDKARAAVREKYDHIFVDEYQDVNPAQEKLIDLLGGEEIFLVGDAKQSIYGFRGSRSEYFTQKEREFPCSLALTENFRSSAAVLEAVNRVFSAAMTEEICGIRYARAPMRGGARYGEHDGAVCFHRVIEEETERKERGIYSVLQQSAPLLDAQAELIADLIEEEIGSEWFDADEELVKTVDYGDIAVLVRKKSGDAEKVVAALSKRNIPVTTTASVNVCDFWEARLLIDWLSYLDNPEQDIPFAGALLSCIGGLTDGELAKIRLRFPSPYTFRAACREYAAKMQDGISQKLLEFARKTEYFRALMRVRTAAEMMAVLLSEGLESEIAAKRDGRARLRRVRRLFAGADCNTCDFLRRIKASAVEYSESGGEGAVKVLTMHASKGLEFPIVFLASMDTPFHTDRDEALYTERYGIAPKSYDRARRTVYETVLRRMTLMHMEREEIKEELNLLYVAMTRAEYRLHMFFREAPHALSPRFAKRFSDFIDFYDCGGYFVEGRKGKREPLAHPALPYIPDEAISKELLAARSFRYPYEASVSLPVKSSATDLMRITAEKTRTGGGKGASVEEGLAYHAFLEHVRFGGSAREELARMREEGLLSGAQISLLDEEKLERMLSLPALKALAGKRVYRERTFLVSLPARELPTLMSSAEDEIVLQGAIDLLCEDEEGYLIIDYKFSSHAREQLQKDYAPQLALYKKAVEKITGASCVRAKIVNVKELYEVEM